MAKKSTPPPPTDSGIPSEEAVGEPSITVEAPEAAQAEAEVAAPESAEAEPQPEGAPEQTDNRPRDEDGPQDVTQAPEAAA